MEVPSLQVKLWPIFSRINFGWGELTLWTHWRHAASKEAADLDTLDDMPLCVKWWRLNMNLSVGIRKRDNSSMYMNQFCMSCIPFILFFYFLCKMQYLCLDLHIVRVRGTFWLYTLTSVFLCTRSNQTDVVNVFLSVLHIFVNNVCTSVLCYNDFWLSKINRIIFHICFVFVWFIDKALKRYAWLCSTFESCSWKEDILSFSKVYDFNIINLMELTEIFLNKNS